MRLSRKTNVRNISYSSLSGGINNSVSGDLITDNEMQECENLIYGADSKILMRRGGISSPQITFDYPILGLYYDYETNNYLVFLTNKQVYITNDFVTSKFIGTLSGSLRPMCCKFGNMVWLASGDKLQYYDFNQDIVTVENSPLCDIIFESLGRLLVAKTGDDSLYYSGVGDGENWGDEDDTDGADLFIEIGYKDGGDIVAVLPLATDIIILKSNGHVYQLAGQYPDWCVYLVGRFTDANYRFCATSIGNEIVFVSRRGLKTVVATQDYGNIRTNDLGDKFNSLITKSVFNPTVWHLKRQNSVLIKPNNGFNFIMYNYATMSATSLTFPFVITDVAESPLNIVVAIGNSLHFWSKEYSDDNGTPIVWKIRPKKYIANSRFLVTKIDTIFDASSNGKVNLSLGKINIDVPTLERKTIRTNHSLPEIDMLFTSSDDVIFNNVVLEIADI